MGQGIRDALPSLRTNAKAQAEREFYLAIQRDYMFARYRAEVHGAADYVVPKPFVPLLLHPAQRTEDQRVKLTRLVESRRSTTVGTGTFAAHISAIIAQVLDGSRRVSDVPARHIEQSRDDLMRLGRLLDGLQECTSELDRLSSLAVQNSAFRSRAKYFCMQMAASSLDDLRSGRHCEVLLPCNLFGASGEDFSGHQTLLLLQRNEGEPGCLDAHFFETNGVLSHCCDHVTAAALMGSKYNISVEALKGVSRQGLERGLEAFHQPKTIMRASCRRIQFSPFSSKLQPLDSKSLLTDATLAPLLAINDFDHTSLLGSQVEILRSRLRSIGDFHFEPQVLQSVQRTGNCELKSIYAVMRYLLRKNPIAYQLIRKATIDEASEHIDNNPSAYEEDPFLNHVLLREELRQKQDRSQRRLEASIASTKVGARLQQMTHRALTIFGSAVSSIAGSGFLLQTKEGT